MQSVMWRPDAEIRLRAGALQILWRLRSLAQRTNRRLPRRLRTDTRAHSLQLERHESYTGVRYPPLSPSIAVHSYYTT